MSEKKYKIGLDYHGVINYNPAFFSAFSKELQKLGHEVYVITGGPLKKIHTELAKIGLPYTDIFTIVDYYANKGEVTYFPDGSFRMDDGLWNAAKAKYCREHGIDVQIDDSFIYGEYFTTPYCLYDSTSQSCLLSDGQAVFFDKQSPEKSVRALLQALE